MPSIRKRGNIWYVKWNENGKTREKAISPSKQVAQEYSHKVEGDMYRSKAGLSRLSASWQEFSKKYLEYAKTNKTHNSYMRDKHTIDTFNKLFSIQQISNFVASLLEEYKKKRIEQGKMMSTINRELNTLKNIGSKLLEWNYLPYNPVLSVSWFPRIQNKVRFLDIKEINQILALDCGNIQKALVIGLYTGARASEVLNLQFKDINLDKKEIIISNKKDWQIKERKAKMIPINDNLYNMLNKLKGKPENYIINVDGHKMTGQVLSQLVKRVFIKLKIKDASFHTLRHTFASHLLGAGVSPFEVARLLGHSSLDMVYRVYGHVIPGHISQNISKLPY